MLTFFSLLDEYLFQIIERIEQKRLQQVMAHHSRISNNFIDHPFSIVAGIEKGTLNRYTNVWPFGNILSYLKTALFLTNYY